MARWHWYSAPACSAVYDFSDGGGYGWNEANATSWFRPESICTCAGHHVLHVGLPQHLGVEAGPHQRGAANVDVGGEETVKGCSKRRGISPRVSALSFSICCSTLWGRNVRRETAHIRSRKQPWSQDLYIVRHPGVPWLKGGGGGGLTMKIPQTGLGVARRLVMPWKAQAGQRMRQAFSRKMETRLKREPHHLIKCRRASSFNRLAVMGSYQIRHHRPDAVVRDARRSNSF